MTKFHKLFIIIYDCLPVQIFTIFILLFLNSTSYSQDYGFAQAKDNLITFPGPKAWAFSQYGNYPVSLYTGSMDVNINLIDIMIHELPIQVNLVYNFHENKPSAIPNEVGLGFTLNAGGLITRVLKSLPDDRHGYYFNGGSRDVYNFDRGAYLTDVLGGIIDPESDLYYFRFGDFSGSFYFDKNKKIIQSQFNNLKIVPLLNGYNFIGFEITDDKGNRYEFKESSRSTYSSNDLGNLDYYNSAWHLTKIILLNGVSIDFQFYPNTFNFSDGNYLKSYSQSETDGVLTAIIPSNPRTKNVQTSTHFERYLKRISFPQGRIDFNMSLRKDRGAEHSMKLDAIRLFNSEGAFTNGYEFIYSENNSERLKLNLINKVSPSGSEMYRSFSYNPRKLPWNTVPEYPYYSNQIDYWGYFNGEVSNNERTTIPQTIYDGQLYGEAIREPNLDAARAEILQQIHYPEGGSTSFVYELNDFSSQGEGYTPKKKTQILSESLSFEYEDGNFSEDPYQIIFTLKNVTKVRLSKTIKGAGPYTKWIASGQTSEEKDVTLNAGTYNLGSVLATDYLLHFDNSDVQMASGGITYNTIVSEEINEVSNGYGGGLRIAKIVNTDGEKTHSKRYLYRNNLVSESSSGILTLMPTYAISTRDIIPNLAGVFLSSSPILGYSESELLGYKTVCELNDDGSYTKYHYSTIDEYPDAIASFENQLVNPLLYVRVSRKELRGKLLKEEYFSDKGTLLRSIDYSYTTFDDERTKEFDYIIVQPTFPILTAYASGEQYFDRTSATMNSLYNRQIPFVALTKRVDKLWNGSSNQAKTEIFNYNNILYNSWTSKSFISSQGDSSNIYITRPLDYLSGMESLINKNLHSLTIESVETKSKGGKETVLKGNLNLYNNLGRSTDIFALELTQPLSTFKFSNRNNDIFPPSGTKTDYQPDGRYKAKVNFSKYDSYGNLLEMQKNKGATITYLWGYQGQYPVAKIENATYAEVQTILTATEINNLNAASVSEATIRTTIAKLRNHDNMKKAQVSTYTYKPLVGMTSMTDPRGITEYYQYDGFQRLKDVLDFENNVLKDYRYHYRP